MVVAGADVVAGAGAASGVQSVAAGTGAATGGTGWVVVTVGAGVIGGAGASVATARAIDPKEEKQEEAKSSEVIIELPSEFDGFSQAGIDHNIVVNNTLNGKSISNYYTYKGISQKYIDILESAEVNEIYSTLETVSVNYANNNFNYQTLTQDCVKFKLFNKNTKDVLDLFLEKYLTCSSYSEIETIVNFYTNEVSKSNLKYEEKSALIVGFMIASESPAQWLRN